MSCPPLRPTRGTSEMATISTALVDQSGFQWSLRIGVGASVDEIWELVVVAARLSNRLLSTGMAPAPPREEDTREESDSDDPDLHDR